MIAELKRLWREEPPTITDADAKCAEMVMTVITDNMNRTPCEEDAIRDLLQDPSLGEAVALEIAEWRETSAFVRNGNALIRWVFVLTFVSCAASLVAAVVVRLLN